MVRNEGLPDIRCCNRIINGYEHAREISPGGAQLLGTDGAARGETKLAWDIPSRDRGRRSQLCGNGYNIGNKKQ